jgi:hypothetical protein
MTQRAILAIGQTEEHTLSTAQPLLERARLRTEHRLRGLV